MSALWKFLRKCLQKSSFLEKLLCTSSKKECHCSHLQVVLQKFWNKTNNKNNSVSAFAELPGKCLPQWFYTACKTNSTVIISEVNQKLWNKTKALSPPLELFWKNAYSEVCFWESYKPLPAAFTKTNSTAFISREFCKTFGTKIKSCLCLRDFY